MTKLGKSLVGVGAVGALVVAPVVTAVVLLNKGTANDPRELRTIINATNTVNSFGTADGISYGGSLTGADNAYAHSYYGKLLRYTGENERVQGVVSVGADGEPVYGDPTGDQVYKEKLRLELAEAIIVLDENGQPSAAIFNEDEKETLSALPKYKDLTIHGINDDGIADVINGFTGTNETNDAPNKGAEFVIREGVKWGTHTGSATEHDVVAKDFLYSMYHTALGNNRWRNAPFDPVTNPFGGHGTAGGDFVSDDEASESNPKADTWLFSENLDENYSGTEFGSSDGGFGNSYLYTMFGIETPVEMVKSASNPAGFSGVADDARMIGQFDGKATVRMNAGEGSVAPAIYDGITKFWASGNTLAPVPSSYIDEVESKKTHAKGFEIPEGIAKDLGYYTYAETHTSRLYAGPYYVSEQKSDRFQVIQNPNYWDKEWLADKDTVSKYTADYTPSNSAEIFYQSQYSQYKAGQVYDTTYALLNDDAQLELRHSAETNGLRYASPYNTTSFSADMIPLMTPQAGLAADLADFEEAYLFNEATAKAWYGADAATINGGTHTMADYLKPEAVDFRSQFTAAVNWYGFSRILDSSGGTEAWHAYMPAEIPLGTADVEKGTVYDYKTEFTTVQYSDIGNTKEITHQDNVDHYNSNSDDAAKQYQSAHFDTISDSITALIDAQNLPDGEKLIIPVKERSTSGTYRPVYDQYEKTLELLDPRIDVVFHNYANNWPGDISTKNGLETFGGWGTDYDGVGSMFTGLSARQGTSTPALALTIKEDTTTGGLAEQFPDLAAYGTAFEKYIDETVQNEFKAASQESDAEIDTALAHVAKAAELGKFGNDLIGSTFYGSVTHLIPEYELEDGTLVVDEASQPILDRYYVVLNAALSQFDFRYFTGLQDDLDAVELVRDLRQIGGVSFSITRGISNRSIPSPIVYRNDIIIPVHFNGQSQLMDWKINQDRADEFA